MNLWLLVPGVPVFLFIAYVALLLQTDGRRPPRENIDKRLSGAPGVRSALTVPSRGMPVTRASGVSAESGLGGTSAEGVPSRVRILPPRRDGRND